LNSHRLTSMEGPEGYLGAKIDLGEDSF